MILVRTNHPWLRVGRHNDVDPSGVGELHGSSDKRHGGGERMEAAQVELSTSTQCQWRTAASAEPRDQLTRGENWSTRCATMQRSLQRR
jgi:hypothetical protein